MDPNQLRVRQLQSQGSPGASPPATRIAPEMKDLLVKQAAERAAKQTADEIDAHNSRIELNERHAEEQRQLAKTIAPPAAESETTAKHEKHEKHRKGK